MSRVLVVGIYPPVPGRASVVSMAQVRRHVRAGDDVLVLSPRQGAAHLHASVTGPRGAARVAHLAAEHGVDRVVLALAPGVPFEASGSRRDHRVTAAAYAHLVPRIAALELVFADDVGADDGAVAVLVAAADRIRKVAAGYAPTPQAVPADRVVVDETALPAAMPLPGPVTLEGPSETPPGSLLAAVAVRTARRVLGRHAGTVGRPLRRALGEFRRTQAVIRRVVATARSSKMVQQIRETARAGASR